MAPVQYTFSRSSTSLGASPLLHHLSLILFHPTTSLSRHSRASLSVRKPILLLRSEPSKSRSPNHQNLQRDHQNHEVKRDLALLAECVPVWLDVHADGGPLAGPGLEGVVDARGVDAVEEGGSDETCDEAHGGGEDREGIVGHWLAPDLDTVSTQLYGWG